MLPVAVGFGGTAIAGLAGIYYGAMFGGAVTSILLGIPGDAPSVMTVIDGHALAKRGEAGRALGMSVCASFIGGVIGIVLLALLSVPVAQAALAFGPAEMTALMCFALSLVTVLGGRNILKVYGPVPRHVDRNDWPRPDRGTDALYIWLPRPLRRHRLHDRRGRLAASPRCSSAFLKRPPAGSRATASGRCFQTCATWSRANGCSSRAP